MKNISDILNLGSNAHTKLYKKGEIIQTEGIKNSLAYYVKRGLLRSYTIDEKGKEHIFMFASEGWIIADIESQEFDQPTQLFIDCLEHSEVIPFDRKYFTVTNLNTEQLRENVQLMARRIAVMQKKDMPIFLIPIQNYQIVFLKE